jgi:hypothetical protein
MLMNIHHIKGTVWTITLFSRDYQICSKIYSQSVLKAENPIIDALAFLQQLQEKNLVSREKLSF